jgi:hypothetical protein
MIDKSFVEKLKSEKPLDWRESCELDLLLDKDTKVSSVMSSLSDAEPSLAWRSQLNERLVKVAKRKRKLAFVPWVGGLVTAGAACFAVLMVTSHPTVERPVLVRTNPTVEAELFTVHAQDARQTELVDDAQDGAAVEQSSAL